jgi:sarcosine oxidase subunit beta
MNQHYDAIIIGAGIIGAAVGFELAKKGWKTLNIDKLPAAGYGSTSNSCAIIRTYYSTPDGCALAFEGYHYWRDWKDYIGVSDEAGLAKFVECGSLVVQTEHNQHLKPVIKIAEQLGIPYEQWDAERISERLPPWDLHQFGPVKRPDDEHFGEPGDEQIHGAIFWPQAGYVNDPQLATHNIQRAAEAAGGRFRFNTEISGIRRTTDGRVAGVTLTSGEQIDAPVVVNVAGPHSAKINAMAGVADRMKIKTRALRHEVPHVPSPPDFNYEQRGMVTSDSDVGTYTRPASGGQILIGSEDPPCDDHQWVDPDDFDHNLSERGLAQVMRYAQRLTTMGIPNQLGGVVDLYDVTDDWIPIYDKSDLPGFYLAIGSSGNQFKNAPIAGKLMARLIEACENGQDHDADPVMLHLDYLDQDVSLGFYSRNREINQDSSFSVLG